MLERGFLRLLDVVDHCARRADRSGFSRETKAIQRGSSKLFPQDAAGIVVIEKPIVHRRLRDAVVELAHALFQLFGKQDFAR